MAGRTNGGARIAQLAEFTEVAHRAGGVAAAIALARRPRREGVAGLTAREAEVLVLLARGLSNKQIAERLVITPKTAGNHVEHIYAKIGATSRAAAYADHEETYRAGDAFYMTPGHVPAATTGTEFVQFSPRDQLAETTAAMMANAQRAMQDG
jgi:DNA-binding CsgD family transcriptional regulator